MRIDGLALIAIIALGGACGDKSSRADHAPPLARAGTQSVVGRWALVSLVRNGEEMAAFRLPLAGR